AEQRRRPAWWTEGCYESGEKSSPDPSDRPPDNAERDRPPGRANESGPRPDRSSPSWRSPAHEPELSASRASSHLARQSRQHVVRADHSGERESAVRDASIPQSGRVLPVMASGLTGGRNMGAKSE